MTATLEQARDDLLGMVQTFWDGEATAPAKLLFEEKGGSRPIERDANNNVLPWARANVRHSYGFQSALSNSGGRHRYTELGMLTIELWFPAGKGHREMDPFAQLLVNDLRGTRTENGVILRNVRPMEMGQDGIWFRTNVLADFEYDQVA